MQLHFNEAMAVCVTGVGDEEKETRSNPSHVAPRGPKDVSATGAVCV